MEKIGTYFIGLAILASVTPFLLGFFGLAAYSDSLLFPWAAIVSGVLGTLIHFFTEIKNKTFNLSSITILLSILFIILGVSLMKLDFIYAHYVLFLGMLLVGIWFLIPTKAKEE